MKFSRGISLCLFIAVLIALLGCSVFADEINDATVTNGCYSFDAAAEYLGRKQITDNIGSAVLYELTSDTLMYTWQADEKIYPSSLVKILTALIAVEKGDPQAVVTVTKETLDTVPYYAASAELQPDETITLSDLLYCMMVGSANDAAAVIATHISGSQEAFVKEMNEYAQTLGCTGTQFTNVHGLHDEAQYSTARDMGRILAAAAKNETFLTYFSTIRYIVPATNKSGQRELSSGNFLMNTENLDLYYDSRVVGGRTGVTETGHHCLATLAKKNGMTVVCIVTGSLSTFAEDGNTLTYGSFQETSTLLDACFTGYQVAQILYKGQVLKQCKVIDGENDIVLCTEDSAYAVLPEGVSVTNLSFKYGQGTEQVQAPVSAGQVITDLQIWYGGFCIAQTELTAMNAVRQLSAQQPEDLDRDGSWVVTALIVLACVVLGIPLLLLVIRWIRSIPMLRMRMRTKQYRRSRRRSR
jgi:D-alanyl-D-alanine carboxypeptidase (penicillin-binding protein 5/6)